MKNCHIVIGGGSSGIFLCEKLLEQDDVILIEQGSYVNTDFSSSLTKSSTKSILNPKLWYSSRLSSSSIQHYTIEQKELGYRKVLYQQGYGIGGTSNINAMILTGGHPNAYDSEWPNEWNSHRFKQLFSKVIEILKPQKNLPNKIHYLLGRDKYHDIVGNSTVLKESLLDSDSIKYSYYQCCQQNQRILLQRILQPSQSTATVTTRTTTNVSSRGTLKIIDYSMVETIRFDNYGKAIGVSIISTDPKLRSEIVENIMCEGRGEVILCCGVFESPRLLLSSILRQEMIIEQRIIVDTQPRNKTETVDTKFQFPSFPMLGQNLLDHIHVPVIFMGNWHKILKDSSIYKIPGYTTNGVHGWVYLNEDGSIYDDTSLKPPSIQLVFVDGTILPPVIPEVILPTFDEKHSHFVYIYMRYMRPLLYPLLMALSETWIIKFLCSFTFGFLVCNVHPYSKGKLHLHREYIRPFSKSSQKEIFPTVRYTIDPKYLSDKRDKEILLHGIHSAHKLIRNMIPSGLRYIQLTPYWSKTLMNIYLRYTAQTYFHACGTCPMNDDKNIGVVNSQFQVHGLRNIRIIDASIIPSIPTGPISAVCMALALAGGEFILQNHEYVQGI